MLKFLIYCHSLFLLFSSAYGQEINPLEITKKMNFDNQIAQLTILSIECNRTDVEYSQNLEHLFEKYNFGGIFLQGGSYNDQLQMIKRCKSYSSIPLFIASDIIAGKDRLSSLPSLQTLASLKRGDAIPFQVEPIDSNQSFYYKYGVSLAKQYKAMGFNLFLLPIYENENQASVSNIYQSLGIANPTMYAKMVQLFDGIQSEQILPSIKFYNSTQQVSPDNLNKYIQSLIDYQGFCYVEHDFNDNINARRIFPNSNFFVTPDNFEKLLSIINDAFIQGLLNRNDISNRCLSLLQTKSSMTYHKPSLYKESQNETLLFHQIYRDAITVVKNEYDFLPLKRIDTLHIASLNFGCDTINNFQARLSSYAKIDHFTYNQLSRENSVKLANQLNDYNCIIIYNSLQEANAELIYLLIALNQKKIVLCNNDLPMTLRHYLYTSVNAIVNHYDLHPIAQDYIAQAIFGGIKAQGTLPLNVNAVLNAGFGLETRKTRLGYTLRPEFTQDIDYVRMTHDIDSLCYYSIDNEITPGCQVLIVKDNQIIFNKAYGYHTYEKKTTNQINDIYDLASLTKISATLPIIMKLYCDNKITLDSKLSQYCPEFRITDKRNITIRQLLAHTSRVRATINVFTSAVNRRESPNGRWSSEVRTKYFSHKLNQHLYVNPQISYRARTLSNKPIEGYEYLTKGIYINPAYKAQINKLIISSPLQQISSGKYIYSDLGFVYLQRIVENITGTPLDSYCKTEIFDKLGAYSTDYKAIERLDSSRIVPSSYDKFFRRSELRGYVHDPMAAFMGGVSGNAGLFSTAEDLAKIMTLYLNDGYYGGDQIFCKGCVSTFTNKCDQYPKNRRGLGFDKPDIKYDNHSIACKTAPQCSFGHTGFTGTMAWCDPDNKLIYIFLSNRTYPNEYNNKLIEKGIRTKIQAIIYDSLKKPELD